MNIIPLIGKAVTNDEASYQYFVESIRKFPRSGRIQSNNRSSWVQKIQDIVNMSFGAVAIHTGYKR
jgi:ubiquinone/menaquinone biosynthesis C-methylase UbiE